MTARVGLRDRARRMLRIAALAAAAVLPVSALAVVGAPVQAATSGWLHTDKAAIKTEAGQTYVIKAVAWFGMETSNCAPHGLWSISLDQGLASIASMGFNTIRLPFSNECLAQTSSNSINQSVNPDLVGLSPLKLMDTVIAKAKGYGLNVILDRHRPDSGAQSELWYTSRYSEQQWIADWTMLATRYKSDPTVIGVDLHNEPHGSACWGCGDPARDWQAAATRAGDAVLAVNPKLLIVVEGVERQSDGSSTWWGGGLADAGPKPVTLKVANRVVYSPHDYPSTVFAQTWFQAADYPANLEGVWERNWGYLVSRGTAPVLLGEFGTKYETDSDKAWLKTLVGYLAKKGMSFAYWSFNPNSGDTGGLVTDDWTTKQTAKLDALKPLLGTGTTVTPTPTVTPKPTATPKPTSTPRPTSTPKPTATPTPTPTPKPTPTPTATPTPTPKPTATATPTPKPTTPAPSGSPLTAKWIPQSSWGEGYVAELELTATSAVSSWTVTWPDTSATSVVNSWGMGCSVKSGSSITCTGKEWAGAIQAGQTVRVGIQVAAPRAPSSPTLTVSAR